MHIYIYGICCVPVSAMLYICICSIYGMCLIYNVYVISACVCIWHVYIMCMVYMHMVCTTYVICLRYVCAWTVCATRTCMLVMFVVCVVHEFGYVYVLLIPMRL